MNNLEISGFIFGVLSIYFTIRENIWCWPTGIVNIIFFFALFYQSKLYADMGLQVIFFILSIYGWYEWLHGGGKKLELPITRIDLKGWIWISLITAAGTAGLGYVLASSTDAAVPYLDSLASIMSIIAQYLLARKKLENYLIWIIVDILSIGIYIYKGLNLTAVLFLIYLAMSAIGYVSWRKKYYEKARA